MIYRTAAVALIAAGLPACHDGKADRGTDLNSVVACEKRQIAANEYAIIAKCKPLGPEMRFSGTWFVGLELSAFRSGYFGAPAQLGDLKATKNIVPSPLAKEKTPATNPGVITAFRVSFVGRESLLKSIFPGQQPILMDRVEQIQVVPFDVADYNRRSTTAEVAQRSPKSTVR